MQELVPAGLMQFVSESNRIEGIPEVSEETSMAHRLILDSRKAPTVESISEAVWHMARAPLRDKPGMNVRVGNHYPHQGGPDIPAMLENLLRTADGSAASDAPHAIHVWYETLHPFMDGNGRSGRLLWLWMHLRAGTYMRLGFLHQWYYESLAASSLTIMVGEVEGE